MSVTIVIPLTCRHHAGGKKRIRVNGNTVRDVLAALCSRYPALEPEIFSSDGTLSPYMEVFINGESVYPGPLQKRVRDKDEVRVAPVVAGG